METKLGVEKNVTGEDLRHAGVRAVGKPRCEGHSTDSRASTFLSDRQKTPVRIERVEKWHAMYTNRSRQKIYGTQVVERGKPN